jgi:hypothetical protein
MTRDPNADEIVTRWVDDGPEAAPERFVWAALERVERTSQRGAWRVALENTPMLLKFAVPAVGVAAAIVLGIVIYGSLNPAPTGAPVNSPAAVATPTASDDPCRRDVAEVPTPGTLDVMWCVPRGTDRIIVPFTIEAPESWIDEVYTGGELLYFRPPAEPAVIVAVSGPDTVDEWVEEISGNPLFIVQEPETLETRAGDAKVITVLSSEIGGPASPIFRSSDVPLYLTPGKVARVWILDGPDGEAVAFGTVADQTLFTEWVEAVGEAVETVEWNTTP